MKTLISIISVYFFVSCQGPKEIIFRAEKVETENITAIEIYQDYQYQMIVNDSLLEEGEANLNGQKLILTPKPKNILTSLIHHREFSIDGNEFCVDRKSTRLNSSHVR